MPWEVLEKVKGPERSKGRRDCTCAMIWCCAAVYMVQRNIIFFLYNVIEIMYCKY
jgi:hypothetical protein